MEGITIKTIVGVSLAGVFMMGCTSITPQASPGNARPPAIEDSAALLTAKQNSKNSQEMQNEPTGRLKLEEALGAALSGNPDLAAYSYGVRAAEARVLQAGASPNPKFGIEVEEFDRDGEGMESAEISIRLAQTFEVGGKRRWRKRMAEVEGELAGWKYERQRLDVFAECSMRFIEALVSQERLALAKSSLELAQKTSDAVRDRVDAGKEPPPQAVKSEAELEMVRLQVSAASNDLRVVRKKLAAMWGGEEALFESVEGALDRVLEEVPSLSELRPKLEESPNAARWGAELRHRRMALSAERAACIPDVEASVGYLQFEEDGTDAIGFGVALPLPLFDRNSGNIKAAQYELKKAELAQSAARFELIVELEELHSTLEEAHKRVRVLRDRVVPAMETAYQAAHEGYLGGKYSFMEMLDAQRGFFGARSMMIDALYDYHVGLVAIKRITGGPINELVDEGDKEE